jgi:hypothetical protein
MLFFCTNQLIMISLAEFAGILRIFIFFKSLFPREDFFELIKLDKTCANKLGRLMHNYLT